jgi:uncharacterized surface protein with fasciclin (FAS1) repeats
MVDGVSIDENCLTVKRNQTTSIAMKNFIVIAIAGTCLSLPVSCNTESTQSETQAATELPAAGQSSVTDNDSQKDIVRVAATSPDHSTLVTALKAAAYVDALSNAGPFTVFAPTNSAFEKLPAGTVEDLLKPENRDALRNVLEYHVAVGVYKMEYMRDGQNINEVNLDNVVVGVKEGKYTINGAEIVATVPASNGVIYVINEVLLPPTK